MVEISGITESLSRARHLSTNKLGVKKSEHTAPQGLSSISTIQPASIDESEIVPIHHMDRASNNSPKDFTVTIMLAISLWLIGAHDFYTGHTIKGISKVVSIGLACFLHPALLLYPFLTMIVDIAKLLILGIYKDGDGKLITE